MSQHILEIASAHDVTTVTIGWDRPMAGYFMTVYREGKHAQPAGEECLYDTDDLPEVVTVDGMKQALMTLGIECPQEMFTQVQSDCRHGVGNRYAVYTSDGRFADRVPY